MRTVGAYEAKTHLPRLLDEVEAGETVVVTKHGRPVAKIVPVHAEREDPTSAIDALRAARAGVRRGRTPVRRMIEEGRR
jgi:prevent-host-death family protein